MGFKKPVMYQGADFKAKIYLRYKDTGGPVDLSTVTNVKLIFKGIDGQGYVVELGSGITKLTPDGAGILELSLTEVETANIKAMDDMNIEAEVFTNAGADNTIEQKLRAIDVKPRLYTIP